MSQGVDTFSMLNMSLSLAWFYLPDPREAWRVGESCIEIFHLLLPGNVGISLVAQCPPPEFPKYGSVYLNSKASESWTLVKNSLGTVFLCELF